MSETGIHSGDSISVTGMDIDDALRDVFRAYNERASAEPSAVGLVNIQYILKPGNLVIVVNPRRPARIAYICR